MNNQGILGALFSKKWNSVLRISRIVNSRFENDPNRPLKFPEALYAVNVAKDMNLIGFMRRKAIGALFR